MSFWGSCVSFVPNAYQYCLLYATEGCPLLSRRPNRSSFEFAVTRLFMKLFRTASPAVVQYQLALNFLPVHSQLDIPTANFLQKCIVHENSLCYLFSLTARRKLDEQFAQFDSVKTACLFQNAIYLRQSKLARMFWAQMHLWIPFH